MEPKKAINHLWFIVDNQQTVSTSRLKKIVSTLSAHQRMLEVDNRRLRRRIKKQREIINQYEDLPKRAEVTE